MQRFILVAGLVALFMYAGFSTQATRATAVPPSDLGVLRQSLSAAGADLDTVLVAGWVEVAHADAADRLSASLGWTSPVPPPGETRDLRRYQRDGKSYVGVRWLLTAAGLKDWQAKAERARQALGTVGPEPMLTVQLAGLSSRDDLLSLEGAALDVVHATARQPWSDQRSASVAAQSKLLPPGPFGTNIQVAARRNQADGKTRVWVAWPALQQEY